ncbi:hypothetical protein GY45DRAFT_692083 [Cubamyces sp. BRFM 1775]|nr:hypothetical protein GY45DRAFT_692083 [Cubamyces sp. BRFM 1775]
MMTTHRALKYLIRTLTMQHLVSTAYAHAVRFRLASRTSVDSGLASPATEGQKLSEDTNCYCKLQYMSLSP